MLTLVYLLMLGLVDLGLLLMGGAVVGLKVVMGLKGTGVSSLLLGTSVNSTLPSGLTFL